MDINDASDTVDARLIAPEEQRGAADPEARRTSGSLGDGLPTAPDGGWGWVVCAAAFFSMVILDGMMFSFGVLFLELLDFFQTSKSQTAMVGSALMGTHLLAGPFTSAMVNAWGLRAVAMTGSVLATVAFACSIFSPSVTVMTILYGFVGGFGVSMIYLPSILAVGFYFEKRRALANGITHSGSGIGTFLYSPLTEYLVGVYGWKGTMLILSGLVLNCFACSTLFIPVRVNRGRRRGAACRIPDREKAEIDGCKHPVANGDVDGCVAGCGRNEVFYASMPVLQGMSLSTPGSPKCRCHAVDAKKAGRCTPSSGTSTLYRTRSHAEVTGDRGRSATPWTMKPLYKKDAFYSGSLMHIPEYRRHHSASLYSPSPRAARQDQTDPERSESVSSEPRFDGCRRGINDSIKAAGSMLRKMAGVKLLLNRKFFLCMMSMVMWTTHSSVLTILPDCAVLRGVSRDNAAFLLSIIGVTNTAARVLTGWLSDLPEVNCLWVNIAALMLGGVSCLGIAFSTSFLMLALESAVFGLCMGTWTSLRPIMLVEVLGLENLTNAFGLVAMFQGIAFLIGPPIAGLLYQCVLSYTIPFVMAAAAFTSSGVLCIILYFCTRSSCR